MEMLKTKSNTSEAPSEDESVRDYVQVNRMK